MVGYWRWLKVNAGRKNPEQAQRIVTSEVNDRYESSEVIISKMNWITGVSKTRVIGRRVPRSVSREEPNITSLLLSLIRVLRGMFFVFTQVTACY